MNATSTTCRLPEHRGQAGADVVDRVMPEDQVGGEERAGDDAEHAARRRAACPKRRFSIAASTAEDRQRVDAAEHRRRLGRDVGQPDEDARERDDRRRRTTPATTGRARSHSITTQLIQRAGLGRLVRRASAGPSRCGGCARCTCGRTRSRPRAPAAARSTRGPGPATSATARPRRAHPSRTRLEPARQLRFSLAVKPRGVADPAQLAVLAVAARGSARRASPRPCPGRQPSTTASIVRTRLILTMPTRSPGLYGGVGLLGDHALGGLQPALGLRGRATPTGASSQPVESLAAARAARSAAARAARRRRCSRTSKAMNRAGVFSASMSTRDLAGWMRWPSRSKSVSPSGPSTTISPSMT